MCINKLTISPQGSFSQEKIVSFSSLNVNDNIPLSENKAKLLRWVQHRCWKNNKQNVISGSRKTLHKMFCKECDVDICLKTFNRWTKDLEKSDFIATRTEVYGKSKLGHPLRRTVIWCNSKNRFSKARRLRGIFTADTASMRKWNLCPVGGSLFANTRLFSSIVSEHVGRGKLFTPKRAKVLEFIFEELHKITALRDERLIRCVIPSFARISYYTKVESSTTISEALMHFQYLGIIELSRITDLKNRGSYKITINFSNLSLLVGDKRIALLDPKIKEVANFRLLLGERVLTLSSGSAICGDNCESVLSSYTSYSKNKLNKEKKKKKKVVGGVDNLWLCHLSGANPSTTECGEDFPANPTNEVTSWQEEYVFRHSAVCDQQRCIDVGQKTYGKRSTFVANKIADFLESIAADSPELDLLPELQSLALIFGEKVLGVLYHGEFIPVQLNGILFEKVYFLREDFRHIAWKTNAIIDANVVREKLISFGVRDNPMCSTSFRQSLKKSITMCRRLSSWESLSDKKRAQIRYVIQSKKRQELSQAA